MAPRLRSFLLVAALSAAPMTLRAQESYIQLSAFSDVLNYVRTNYTDSVGYPEMVRAAISGVLRSLDPHSYFLAREDFARRGLIERGELATTGLFFELVEGRPTVSSILEGSPAARARIQPGDRLRRVDWRVSLRAAFRCSRHWRRRAYALGEPIRCSIPKAYTRSAP